MPFEKFIPKTTRNTRPKVTVRPSGLISFDAQAVENFGLFDATHAVLYFDKSKKKIGVKTMKDGNEEAAIPFVRRRRSVSLKASGFFDRFGISLPAPKRLDASFDESEGMIVINMTSVRRRPGRPRRVRA